MSGFDWNISEQYYNGLPPVVDATDQDYIMVFDSSTKKAFRINRLDFMSGNNFFLPRDGSLPMVGSLQCDTTLDVDGVVTLNDNANLNGLVNTIANQLVVGGISSFSGLVDVIGGMIAKDSALIACEDSNGIVRGAIGGGDDLGMVLFGGETFDDAGLASVVGEAVLLLASSQFMTFNGAESGDFLRLTGEVDVGGNQVFAVGSVALDVTLFSEIFTNNSDVVVPAGGYAICVQGTTTQGTYTDGSSQANYSFRLENTANADRNIQYYVGQNGGLPGPGDIFFATVPRAQGGINGVLNIGGSDSVTNGDIALGSTVELQIQGTDGVGVICVGSQTPTTLGMEQTNQLSNALQKQVNLLADTALVLREYAHITSGTVFSLPSASAFLSGKPQQVKVKNATGIAITINADGTDTIYAVGGSIVSDVLADGESQTYTLISNNQWDT